VFDATTRVHLWSDRFEGSLENICELQDQVASGVVGAVDPKLLEAEMARVKRKPTANPDAFDCFLRASALIHQWQLRAMKRRSAYSTRPSSWIRIATASRDGLIGCHFQPVGFGLWIS
jgi:hypothetical protein